MAGVPIGPFSMPMYRDFVPKPVRPWIHLVFVFFFQLTGCFYLGAASKIVGTTGLMSTDVMMIGLCNVVGVNMPFPFLFNFKFRFSNRQLLINAALMIAICNFLALYTTSVPILCLLAYLAGFFKLCGTFECFGTVQLWITSKRDFSIFFPLIYIIVIGDIALQGWFATWIAYYLPWQMINWIVIGIMLLIVLVIWLLCKNFYIMKMPMLSMDWLGCILWSACMIEVIFLFNYGEYYNWWDSPMWRMGLYFFIITLFATLHRAHRIRHPYIDLDTFKYKTMVPLLLLYGAAEWLSCTPKVLQNAYMSGVMHWGALETSRFELLNVLGTAIGCLFTLWWMKGLKQKYTRLLFIGGAGLVAYQVMMYFLIAPNTNIEKLYLPVICRSFGYAIYFTALTIYLEELLPFQPFFMGLTISGFMRNGPVEAMMNGIYSFFMRHQMAENMVRTDALHPLQTTMVSIKQLYGITCILGVLFILALLAYDVKPIRSTMKLIPHWTDVGHKMRKVLRRSHRQEQREEEYEMA